MVLILAKASPAITALIALISFCVNEYRLHSEKYSNIKINDLKAIIDKLEKEEERPKREILNSQYNRLLSSILENSARERYYELYGLENKLNLGYFTRFVCGMLVGAMFLNFCIVILILIGCIPKDYLKKIINIKITMNENDLNNLQNNLAGGFFVSVYLLAILFLVVVLVGNAKGTKNFLRKNFNEDIHDSYRYRYRYHCEVLADDSLKKSLALAEKRKKQHRFRKLLTVVGGMLYSILLCIIIYLPINNKQFSAWRMPVLLPFVCLNVGIVLIFFGTLLQKFTRKHIRFATLPKIKTVESRNKRWHEDKDKEEYFLKVIEYIARSRDSVLYIGSEDVENSVPSHYINLVSTSYEYMNIEKLKWDHKSPKMSSYGTIIIDFIVLPDLSEYRVLETVGSLLKFDGELFVRRRKVRGKKAKEKLKTDKKTIEKLSDVAYFPTELERYQMLGFRKNEN